ncbi:MAG: proline dehydrogenase family protein, partial [Flavobacteriaceae bacterium]
MLDTKIFNDTKHAFILKDDDDLKRSLFIFSMMNIPFFVPISTVALNAALSIKLPIQPLIKKTIFKQFCGGETQEETLPLIKLMYTKNVHSVLDY